MMPLANRTCQGLFKRPAALESMTECGPSNTKTGGPIHQAQCYSSVRQQPRATGIAHLFCLCAPAHITWFIVTVVINSLKGVVGWTTTHISKKCRIILPAFTDFDSAATVTVESTVAIIVATRHHCLPTSIFPRCFAAARFTVLLHGFYFTPVAA